MKQWTQVCAFVLATLAMQSFPEGALELSEEDKKKLDAASKTDGFAEKFQADYNKKQDEEGKKAAAQQPDFSAFMEAEASEEEEAPLSNENPEGFTEAQQKRMNELLAENKLLASQNKENEGKIAKLEKQPDDTPPEIINAQLRATVKHSKTHLFASNENYDAFEGRPWNQAAKQAIAGIPITAETDWNQTANIDQLNSDIQDYFRKDPMRIHDTLLDGLQRKKYVELVSGVSDEYLHTSIVTGEITQSLKKKFLPKNKAKFVVEKGKVFDIQIDMLFEGYELKKLEKSYLKNFTQLGITDSNPWKMRFVMWVVQEIMKRARKEDKIALGRGVYFKDEDRDTPGSFMNTMNGFQKLIKDARGTKYKPFDNGTPTETNIFNYVNSMCEQLPYDVRILPDLQFVLSPYWKRKYNDARETLKGPNTNFEGDIDNVDNFPNIELVVDDQLESTNLMYITTKDNEYILTDKPGEDGFIQFVKGGGDNPRNIQAFGDYKLAPFIAVFGRKQYDKEALDYNNQLFFSNNAPLLVDTYVPVAENDATPSLAIHHSLVIGNNNTSATDITNFDDGTPGEKVYLLGDNDTNPSTVKNNSNIILADGDFVLNNGNVLVLQVTSGGKFVEVSRKVAGAVEEAVTVQLAADATTANAEDGNYFITQANSGATEITDITNAVEGEQYRLEGGSDTNATTIASGGNFLLSAGITLTDGVYIIVEKGVNKFYEVERG